ncbi:MAG: mannose-6-phosphate isomerase, partial [Oscillospiraceae bacterium]|nr:mannose-6-phosphate isomerase [Oscillospiraceae bacterium]
MKPFLLKPACKASIWGGTKLTSKFGKDFPGDIISESWELSVHPAGLSLANSGDEKGKPLAELIRDLAVLGTNPAHYPTFPLMIKWIDSQRPLSIQVHP